MAGLAAAVVICPPLGIAVVRTVKPLFGRLSEGALAYPSGHVTTLVVVAGLVLETMAVVVVVVEKLLLIVL